MTKNTRTILGWCFYDFANQPFTTIVVTFIYSAYFVGGISSETGLAGGIVGSSAMGQVYWGYITAICAVVIALLSPVMGAAADQGGYRKSFLLFWTWICIIFSILLFFPTYGDIYIALILFAIANIAFEMGSVFCNAYVSDISQSNNMGKISGYGYAFGYLGGLLALIFCLLTIYVPEKPMFGISKEDDGVMWESCVSNPEWEEGYGDEKWDKAEDFIDCNDDQSVCFGDEGWEDGMGNGAWNEGEDFTDNNGSETWNDAEPFIDNNSNGSWDLDENFLDSHILKEKNKKRLILEKVCGVKNGGEQYRAMNIVVAIWFSIFSLFTFLWLDKDKHKKKLNSSLVKDSFNQLRNTFRNIKKINNTFRFLIARLFYNDALITIFAFGGIIAKSVYEFEDIKMLIFGITLGVAAGLGAFLMGYIDDYVGPKKTIQISNILLVIATIMVVFVNNETVFWAAGFLVGFASGPNQASSRSLMARLSPKDKQNEFFGFFAFSGKITAFLGPILLAQVTFFSFSYLKLSEDLAQRAGISVVLLLIIIGATILHFVDEENKPQ